MDYTLLDIFQEYLQMQGTILSRAKSHMHTALEEITRQEEIKQDQTKMHE